MLARYAKASSSKPCGTPLWFQSHRIVQSCAVLLSLVGLGIAVAMVQQTGSAHFGSVHGALGLAVVLLGVLQPVNAAFRPNPHKPGGTRSPACFLWEVIHRIGGYGAVLGGAAAIFLGLARAGAAVGFSIAYGLAILAPLLLLPLLVGRDSEWRGCQAKLARPHLPPLSSAAAVAPPACCQWPWRCPSLATRTSSTVRLALTG